MNRSNLNHAKYFKQIIAEDQALFMKDSSKYRILTREKGLKEII
jgi:hypothetical protein